MMSHAERAAHAQDGFWCEPGARNARMEFKFWLHMECRLPSFLTVPWPFASAVLDADILLAHYHISNFENWPGEWWHMRQHLTTCMRGQRGMRGHRGIGGFPSDEFYWGLFGTPIRNQLAYTPKYAIPKEFIDALTGPRKASR
jgi:hypothetical protein